jgi:uncharacterized protein YraI
MAAGRRARQAAWPVLVSLVMLAIVALACNLSGGGDEKEAAKGTQVGGANLPSVVVQAPDNGAQVLVNTDVLIYAVATDTAGVTRVELSVNNQVIAAQASPNLDGGDTEFQVLLKWRPLNVGEQTLEIVPWRGDLAGKPATLRLVVRQKASEITQTPAPTLSFLTPTQIQDRTCRAQVAVGALNVRTGPGLVYDVIGSVTIGQVLPIIGRQLYPDPWWQVFYNGRAAWVSGYYVNQLGECAGIGIVVPPPTPTPRPNTTPPTIPPTLTPLPPSPTPVIPTAPPPPPGTRTPTPTPEPCRVRVNVDGLPVFSGPGSVYTRMTVLVTGQEFAVTGRDPSGQWWQIAIADTFGWVEAQSVTSLGACARVPSVSVPPTPSPTASNTPTDTPLPAATLTLTITASPTPTNTPTQSATPTNTPVPSDTPLPTATSTLTMTASATPTLTPTASDTPTLTPTASDTPTGTLAPSDTPLPTETPTLTPTATDTPTDTPVPSDTPLPTETPTWTPTASDTPTDTPVPSDTPLPTETPTWTPTATDTPTDTPVPSDTPLPTETPTWTPTATDTPTDTPVPSDTPLPTETPTWTPTATDTPTDTPSPTDTLIPTATLTFTPTPIPNRDPAIELIAPQNLVVGQSVDVPYTATDPDGDPLTVLAQSDNEAVVQASILEAGQVHLQANNPGSATVTLTADDGRGGTAQVSFTVTVERPNQNPTIEPIPNQTLAPGQALDVPYTATDPDGDPLTVLAQSDNEAVVQASILEAGQVHLQANNPGSATVTLTADDGRGGTAQTSFAVTVTPPNQNPTIEPIPDQALTPGQALDVPYTATDPDGNPLTVLAQSDNEAVVQASILEAGQVHLQANNPGSATVTLTADDGRGGTAQVSFTVTVERPNQNPAIEPIPDLALTPGQALDVPYTATDPDGNPLTVLAQSDNEAVVQASILEAGQVHLQANNPGSATVTLTADDGRGGTAQISFAVTVTPPNQNPAIELIAPQNLVVGQSVDVPYTATDPDGDPLTVLAQSDNEAVVQASILLTGRVRLQANNPGSATVTLTADDGRGGTAQTSFAVTVTPPNQNPAIEPIPDQALTPGQALDVPYTATDPDGDPLTVLAQSDNEAIVQAGILQPGQVHLQTNNPGSATVTLTADDGRGGTAQTSFAVTVTPPNQNPAIEPIPDQALAPGQALDLPYTATDPDGDPLTVLAQSDNEAIVQAGILQPGQVHLQANNPGSATVTLTADDGRGGTAQISFAVTVEETPPAAVEVIDLNQIPNITPIEQDEAVLSTIRGIYQRGIADPGVFSVAGDTPPGAFLGDLGDGTANFNELQDAADLDSLVFYYTSTPLPVGGNSFQSGGALSTNPNWRASDLLDPAQAVSGCEPGEVPLACELRVNRPAVLLVSVGRNDVRAGTPLDQFRAALEAIVQTSTNGGAIPVLMTIPGDPGAVPTLQQYNTVIVQVAQDYHIPLLNVWRRVNDNAPAGVTPDLQLTSSGAGDQFTQAELGAYGVPNRNLLALRVLQRIRVNVPIP